MSAAQIAGKFLGLSEGFLGARRATAILDRLWSLEDLEDIAQVPRDCVL